MKSQQINFILQKKLKNNVVLSIVKAKDWFENNVKYPATDNDFVVCKWCDFHDGLKSNIEGRETIAICRQRSDAELVFMAKTNANYQKNPNPPFASPLKEGIEKGQISKRLKVDPPAPLPPSRPTVAK